MRCAICDEVLSREILKTKTSRGEFRDTCDTCQGVVNEQQDQWDYIEDLKLTVDMLDE